MLLMAGFFFAKDLHEQQLKRESEYEPRVMDAVMQVSARPLSKQWRDGQTFGVLPEDLDEATGTGASNYIADAVRALESTAPRSPHRPDADYHRARWLLLLEDPDGAELALRSALSRSADFVPGRALLARILEKRGAFDASREELDRAAASSQFDWAQAWIAAHRAVDDFRWEEAEASFGTLIEVELSSRPPYAGSMMESLVGRGKARLQLEDYTGAIEDFARAEHLWPRWPVPTLFKAKAYARMGKPDHAEAMLMALWEQFEHKDEIAFQAIQLFKHLGAYERSHRWTDRLSTPYLRACFQAHLSVFNGQLEAGMAAAREAIRLNPRDVFARIAVGFIAFNDSRLRGPDMAFAEQCCREAVTNAAKPSQGYLFLALVLHKQGRTEAALAECQKGIQVDPSSPWSYEGKGYVLFYTGAYSEAIAAFERAVELDPLLPVPRGLLARALLEASRYDAAINAGKASVRIAPGYDDLWCGLAKCLEKSGRIEEATDAYRNASRKLPQSWWTSQAFAELVRLLVAQGRIQEALAEARAAVESNPTLNGVNYELRGLLRNDRLSGFDVELRPIVTLLEKAAASGKEDPAVLKTLAEAWNRGNPLRDSDKALRYAALANEKADASDLEAPLILAEVQFASGLGIEAVRTLEKALAQKGSNEQLLETLRAHRKALLPHFASYASIDAEVTGAERARSALADLAPLSKVEGGTQTLLYLEGRLLQLEGRHAEALDRFERLADEDGEQPEPFFQSVACLRAAEDFAGAEAKVRSRLTSSDTSDRRELYELWAKITFLDQRRDTTELIDAVPLADEPAAADLRWLLGTIASGRPIRINCGGEDFVSENGGGWSRDRFFTSGQRFRERKGEEGGTAVYPFEGEIAGTKNPDPYFMNRVFPPGGPVKAGYRVPLIPGGYRLQLHFAETWFRGPGMRSFDVIVEGERVLESYEPFQAGFAAAKVETFDIQVEDALLEIEFVHKIGNPFISAIEVERRQ
jgi:tetratricopeptide (TPR) repeat protein